jgi:predicted RNA-binding Zn-ribbon protein involved in translation (DUF1610 family)
MTAIRTKCPTCGDVNLAADEMSLSLHPSGERGAYRFTCPECSAEIDRPASRKVVALLIAAGVEATRMGAEPRTAEELPEEDRSPYPAAAAFTMDDVIAFHFLLEDDVAIAELFSLER